MNSINSTSVALMRTLSIPVGSDCSSTSSHSGYVITKWPISGALGHSDEVPRMPCFGSKRRTIPMDMMFGV